MSKRKFDEAKQRAEGSLKRAQDACLRATAGLINLTDKEETTKPCEVSYSYQGSVQCNMNAELHVHGCAEVIMLLKISLIHLFGPW